MNNTTLIDKTWFLSHLTGLVDLIYKKTYRDSGLFFPHFDFQWRMKDETIRTLVSQSRLIFNFSQAWFVTGEERYREAVEKGADALLDTFKDREFGGLFWSCDGEGNILEDRKDCYGHAFVIFALSHAARAAKEDRYVDEALSVWEETKKGFRDGTGGYVWDLNRKFEETGGRRSQNPMMHLFEALLELTQIEGMSHVREDAWDIGDFILHSLRRSSDGLLPEYFDPQWKELPAEEGGNVDVGHAFEWAFLLSRACELGLPDCWAEEGEMFLEKGMEMGFDKTEGGVFSPASPDGKSVRKIKGWWEQCEAARALMHYMVLRGRKDLREPLQKTMGFIRDRMIDQEHRGWYTFLKEGEDHRTQDKLDHWKIHYHAVGLCMEAIRLSECP